jgi:quercetin dioxygenase-like cupin family protein
MRHCLTADVAYEGAVAHDVFGGHEQVLRPTLIALASGQELGEHDSPGEATLQVLHGRVRLATTEASWDGSAGDLLIILRARNSLRGLEDAAVLLTVAKIG